MFGCDGSGAGGVRGAGVGDGGRAKVRHADAPAGACAAGRGRQAAGRTVSGGRGDRFRQGGFLLCPGSIRLRNRGQSGRLVMGAWFVEGSGRCGGGRKGR